MAGADIVLDVEALTTVFELKAGAVRSVNDVSFSLRRGEILGLVGESGSGKSVTGLSIMGLIAPPGKVRAGHVAMNGAELTAMDSRALRALRGRDIAMIFQDPMTTLNPVLTIGRQFYEVMRAHGTTSRREARARAEAAMVEVGIPAARERLDAYPHELSGGMRQRVCIAMSLINEPSIIIADEPTTALDVTIQAQILAMLQRIVREREVAMIFITHDLSVVAGLCDRVGVMYGGRLVEIGPVDEVLASPAHPYTAGLLASIPGDAPSRSKLFQIPGTQPSPLDLPSGCAFRTRCSRAQVRCESAPDFAEVAPQRLARCHFPFTIETEPDA
ncbi:MAG: ABC transporter ATP-binding protein [Acuticoccus sp.]